VTVTIKYLLFVMRADNGGEGGILALVALVRTKGGRSARGTLVAIGLFGAALLYGDGMITPAISVLSAVEGLGVATHVFEPFVVPITVVILIGLFLVQHRGTGGIGTVFGPIMIVWFLVLAALGIPEIAANTVVLKAVDPLLGLSFLRHQGLAAFLTLGSVFLSVTGAEALYADMGHFGRRPIRIAWFWLVLPSLMLNYLGQGALLLKDASARQHPFFHLAPDWALYPMVLLSTIATVIASQAVISGAFSLTQQAIQLGYSPRFEIQHTSAHEKGQVYIPEINWMLMVATVGLVFGFRTSTNLAAAYGMAVTTTMVITTMLAFVVARERWKWSLPLAGAVTGAFVTIDLAFFGANVIKIEHGGWFPLLVAGVVYAVMSTWHKGRLLVVRRLAETEIPLSRFFESVRQKPPVRVSGTGIFMTARPEGAPPILVHHMTHNKVLHEQVILLTASIVDTPTVDPAAAIEVESCTTASGAWSSAFGFMETRLTFRGAGEGARTRAELGTADTHLLPRAPDAVRPVHGRLGMGMARTSCSSSSRERAPGHELLPHSARPRRRNRHPAIALTPGRRAVQSPAANVLAGGANVSSTFRGSYAAEVCRISRWSAQRRVAVSVNTAQRARAPHRTRTGTLTVTAEWRGQDVTGICAAWVSDRCSSCRLRDDAGSGQSALRRSDAKAGSSEADAERPDCSHAALQVISRQDTRVPVPATGSGLSAMGQHAGYAGSFFSSDF
jgi:KUP system potassium uptake protein